MGRWPLLGACLVAACTGPSLMVVGETVELPDPLLVVEVVDPHGLPIAGATVEIGLRSLRTDRAGQAVAEWPGGPVDLAVSAPRFLSGSTQVGEVPSDATVEVALSPVTVFGRVAGPDGRPLPGSVVRLGEARAESGLDGMFRLERVEPGEVRVGHPGWEPTTLGWEGDPEPLEVTLRPRVVRGLYASVAALASREVWARLIETAERTEIDAMVVDLKDSSGSVVYPSRVDLARQSGATEVTYDIGRLLADLEERHLYAVARMVAFEDPVVAEAAPELAVWDVARDAPWRSGAGRGWLDPTDPDARAYLMSLAVEACRLGFDEVQFDYVRFPIDERLAQARFDRGFDRETRLATISGFLSDARRRLHREGCALAADIFGFMTAAADDGRIGQRIEEMSQVVDVLSPMVYPSHYRSGWYGFEEPNDHPRKVVSRALDDGLGRLVGPAIVRPWLQAFSLGPGIRYGPAQVRAQIAQAEERGLGWMLWNPASRFDPGALRPAEEP